jgi:hypothetical protein
MQFYTATKTVTTNWRYNETSEKLAMSMPMLGARKSA